MNWTIDVLAGILSAVGVSLYAGFKGQSHLGKIVQRMRSELSKLAGLPPQMEVILGIVWVMISLFAPLFLVFSPGQMRGEKAAWEFILYCLISGVLSRLFRYL